MADVTELEDRPVVAERRVQIDRALVRGETEAPDPAALRALLRGLKRLDVGTAVQRHVPVTT